ncbi:hypothetical protein [Sphingomonas sp.]|nr:hypothetical protein [Sphingomonas sp.]
MMIAAFIVAYFIASFALASLVGSFMRVGTDCDPQLPPQDIDDGAA